jgi:hypothetical protein
MKFLVKIMYITTEQNMFFVSILAPDFCGRGVQLFRKCI